MNLREYQIDAVVAVVEKLQTEDKCLVKMFCGTGKSIIMKELCNVLLEHSDINLSVFVFPSLALVHQFYDTYIDGKLEDKYIQNLKICSDKDCTTSPRDICEFLEDNRQEKKPICVTYHRLHILLDNLGDNVIGLCCFDEAHHAVGHTYQKLIFDNHQIEKQVFFTTTPINSNGIVMYDRDDPENGDCGPLCYEYCYLRGVEEDYLNSIELRLDLSLEDTNVCKYESISRAILQTGNARVLTFHATVNGSGDTSVNAFVDKKLFRKTFRRIVNAEFPERKGQYTRFRMIGMDSTTSSNDREKHLAHFQQYHLGDSDDSENSVDNTVIILSTCQTIGEGVDTFDANMCVFIDPKTSHVQIIQNIGRIVRKPIDVDIPPSTVLLCCYVD